MWQAIEANHAHNCILWAEEDLARRRDVPDSEIAANKRAIDANNQKRNDAIERHRPMASLHGHVHESAGFRRIGKTLAVNPGSDYGTGALNGALLVLDGEKVRAHQLVRG